VEVDAVAQASSNSHSVPDQIPPTTTRRLRIKAASSPADASSAAQSKPVPKPDGSPAAATTAELSQPASPIVEQPSSRVGTAAVRRAASQRVAAVEAKPVVARKRSSKPSKVCRPIAAVEVPWTNTIQHPDV